MDSAQHAVALADALLDNPTLKAEDGVNVLLDGLVKNRVGSSVKPPAQLMAPDVRATLGDRIVRWGIKHGDWGTNDAEKEKHIVELDAFVNGPLATLVGCAADAADTSSVVEAKEGGGEEQEEEKEGKCDNNMIQSVACGEGGRDDITKARERIATKMVVVTLKEFAECVGLAGGAGGDIKDGVEFDEEGQITKIDWKKKNLNGNLEGDRLGDVLKRMPRLRVLDLRGNEALTGTCGVLCLCSSQRRFVGRKSAESATQPHSFPHSSLYPYCLFFLFRLPFLRGHRPDEPPRGHAECGLRGLHGHHRYGRESRSEWGSYFLNRFRGQPHALPHSSFLILSFFPSLPSLSQVTSASSCSPRACRV
jgi:hypothetical protein